MRPPSECSLLLDRLSVSRETLDQLEQFADVLLRWNRRINLISEQDVDHLWMRHIVDSLQCIPHLPPTPTSAIDLGSGGGFPGLILAIATSIPFTLVESDQRKSAFLREAARLSGVKVRVAPERIERAAVDPAPLITARALAPLGQLLDYAQRLALSEATFVFLKGKTVDEELTLARQKWQMQLDRFPSVTSPTSCVLRIRDIKPIT